MVIIAFLQIGQLLPMTIGGNVTTRLVDNQGTLTRLCNTSGRPSAGFIPTTHMGKRSSPRLFRQQRHASLIPLSPLDTSACAPVPGRRRCPGDFRSYCHAPASLWPSEPSTDSLDLTHYRPARVARLFQTGALPAHKCPVKPGITGKRSR